MAELDFLRVTRASYDAVAADYAEHFRDELASKPLDRALLAAMLEHRATIGDVLNALQNAALRADEAVREVAATDSGTTLTALAWSGSELAFVHIGDSRVYLLRHGVLVQLTHDHTVVQGLIDDGTLTAAEAESHP